MEAALAASAAGRAEKDQTLLAVPGVQHFGGCEGTRVKEGLSIGYWDWDEGAEHVDEDHPSEATCTLRSMHLRRRCCLLSRCASVGNPDTNLCGGCTRPSGMAAGEG